MDDRSYPMFKAIDVWRRVSDSEAVRYRCFQCLQTGKYSVQSADFYRLPENPAQSDQLDRNTSNCSYNRLLTKEQGLTTR